MEHKCGSKAIEPIIWIIGESVLMEGVRSCLAERRYQSVFHLGALTENLIVSPPDPSPNLIIFDLQTNILEKLTRLLEENSSIRLLGLDHLSNQVIVLDYFQQTTCSMDDLFRVIREITATDEGFRKEAHAN